MELNLDDWKSFGVCERERERKQGQQSRREYPDSSPDGTHQSNGFVSPWLTIYGASCLLIQELVFLKSLTLHLKKKFGAFATTTQWMII